MKELELLDFDDVAASGVTKKELLQKRREYIKLLKTLGGIRDMARVPAAVWIVDTKKEHLAVDEARKLKLPIIGILDTNCDPDEVDFPIPGNDDAIRSVGLLTRVIADAVADGLMSRGGQGATAAGEELGAEEPLAAWERELLESQNGAAKADEAPAAEAKTEEAPATEATEAKADEAPAAEVKTEEAPAADEAPAAEAKADEAPADEAKTEEAPAAEAPKTEA
jgi:small subunit ribosomal protein S2